MQPKEYFKNHELECGCGCGMLPDLASVEKLYALRICYGKPIKLTSACRCEAHNKAVGGKPNSSHLIGAFDCAIPAKDELDFIFLAMHVGFTGIGFYNNRFVHLDAHHKEKTMW